MHKPDLPKLGFYFKGFPEDVRFARHTVPESLELVRGTLYETWYRAIKLSPYMAEAIDSGSWRSDGLRETYGFFGDLRKTTFDDWWANVGYELFREDRDFRRIAVHEVTEDLPEKSIAFIIPLDVSPATLKKQFDRLLAKHHPDYKKFDRWKASSAQQRLRTSKLTSQSLNLYLDVYECWFVMQRDNAQIRLYEVGEHMRLSSRYTVKDDDSDTVARSKHLEMSLLVTEYLSKAKNLIAQASEGKFPCTEDHHWIERSTRSAATRNNGHLDMF